MSRNDAGLQPALAKIPKLREEFWQNVSVPGDPNNLNKNLEYAGRVADYLEFAELLALDALAAHGIVRRRTSAKRARRPTTKRGATTSTFRTSRRGSSTASASRRCCTRNR